MARDTHKHQRKLAKQKAKRQSRKRDIARRQSIGLEGHLRRASAAPILHCLVPADLWEQGLGQVLISRELPNRQVAFAVFLVDVWCLGVKNAFANILPKSEYTDGPLAKLQARSEMRSREPAYVRKLVEQAVAYAQQFDLPPHADYRPASEIFGAIDAAACREDFEFGRDGKPFYFAGPFESSEQSLRIMRRLQEHVGDGNFHFTMPVPGDEWNELEGLPYGMLTSEYEDDAYDDDEEFDHAIEEPPAQQQQRKLFGWL